MEDGKMKKVISDRSTTEIKYREVWRKKQKEGNLSSWAERKLKLWNSMREVSVGIAF
jgi:hypothetical protein